MTELVDISTFSANLRDIVLKEHCKKFDWEGSLAEYYDRFKNPERYFMYAPLLAVINLGGYHTFYVDDWESLCREQDHVEVVFRIPDKKLLYREN